MREADGPHPRRRRSSTRGAAGARHGTVPGSAHGRSRSRARVRPTPRSRPVERGRCWRATRAECEGIAAIHTEACSRGRAPGAPRADEERVVGSPRVAARSRTPAGPAGGWRGRHRGSLPSAAPPGQTPLSRPARRTPCRGGLRSSRPDSARRAATHLHPRGGQPGAGHARRPPGSRAAGGAPRRAGRAARRPGPETRRAIPRPTERS